MFSLMDSNHDYSVQSGVAYQLAEGKSKIIVIKKLTPSVSIVLLTMLIDTLGCLCWGRWIRTTIDGVKGRRPTR